MSLYIFDKDLTLVQGSNGHAPNKIEDQHLFSGVAERCEELRNDGHILAVASNQGGVAYGILSENEAHELVQHAARLIGAVDYEVCTHHPRGKIPHYSIVCSCRKPAPGMILALIDRLNGTVEDTIFVGDAESDREAAEAAGVSFVYANEFFDLK